MISSARRWYGALLLSALLHGFLLSGLSRLWPQASSVSRQFLPELEVNLDRESAMAEPFRASVEHPGGNQGPSSAVHSPQPYVMPEPPHGAHTPTLQPGPQALYRDGSTLPDKEMQPSGAQALTQDENQNQAHEQEQDILGRSLLMARAQVVDPFAGKRVQALSAQTHDLIFGPYAEAWRQKVEQVGALNYPAPDHGHELQGDVRLTVILYPDGSIAGLEMRQSSGIEALDAAAQHIVQMASPFQPFTKAMRERADLVTLTRTFHFIRAGETLEMH